MDNNDIIEIIEDRINEQITVSDNEPLVQIDRGLVKITDTTTFDEVTRLINNGLVPYLMYNVGGYTLQFIYAYKNQILTYILEQCTTTKHIYTT